MSNRLAPNQPSLLPEALKGDLIQPGQPFFGIIWANPARMSGAPCFAGTRVPVQHLFEHLEAGDSIDDFLEGFPVVTHHQACTVLEAAACGLLERISGR